VAAYIEAHSGEVDVNGQRLVVRNGYHAEREVTTAAARSRCGRRGSTTSASTRPPGSDADFFGDPARLGTEVAADGGGVAAAVSPWPVHQRLRPALEQFLGTSHGLSAATITRLTEQWKDDARAFAARSLAEVDYV